MSPHERDTDYFGRQAGAYTRFRPRYPDALFRYLASESPGRRLAWDCAAGSGQATLPLARHFDRVVGTDSSEKLIRHAEPAANVRYAVAPADRTDLEDRTVDLVTVAQALHWFAGEPFFDEVRRVLRPGGVLAAWCYGLCYVDDVVDPVFSRYHGEVVGPYWPHERRFIESGYETILFPFRELSTPSFTMEAEWSLAEFTGYLRTWSAGIRYREATGKDPMDLTFGEFQAAWGEGEEKRRVRWPLHLRAGRYGGA